MRVPEIEDESDRYEQVDFDDEEAAAEAQEVEERRRAFAELPYRKLLPNVKPSVSRPPTGSADVDIQTWVKTTFAPGTPVMFLESGVGGYGGYLRAQWDKEMRAKVPVGARGEVSNLRFGTSPAVEVRIVDARDENGRVDSLIGDAVVVPMYSAHVSLEPLVDNWATRKSYRTVAPHRVTAGRWRTSRPMRPNAWPDWDVSRTESGGLVFRERPRTRRR